MHDDVFPSLDRVRQRPMAIRFDASCSDEEIVTALTGWNARIRAIYPGVGYFPSHPTEVEVGEDGTEVRLVFHLFADDACWQAIEANEGVGVERRELVATA